MRNVNRLYDSLGHPLRMAIMLAILVAGLGVGQAFDVPTNATLVGVLILLLVARSRWLWPSNA